MLYIFNFINTGCLGFGKTQKENNKEAFYILINLNQVLLEKNKKTCQKNLFDFIDTNNEKKKLIKIFEYGKYILYLKNKS